MSGRSELRTAARGPRSSVARRPRIHRHLSRCRFTILNKRFLRFGKEKC
jgi:hypothetical protein